MCDVKLIRKWIDEPFLRTAGLNIIIDNCDNITGVVSTVIDDELVQVLLTSLISTGQNAHQWKISHEMLKWSRITTSYVKKFLSPKVLMGHVRKNNMKSYWSTDPHSMQGIFPPDHG
jgi:hypothetical protein